MKSFEKEEEKVEPKESVAVDVNMSEVIVGKDDEHYAKITNRLMRFRRPRTGRRSPQRLCRASP